MHWKRPIMFRGMKSFFGRTGLLTAAILALAFSSVSQVPAPTPTQAHRLILKDGSYQSVTKYEIYGERVRYFSAERGEWEEVPKALIDWDATDKFEQGREQGKFAPEAVDLDKELDAERKAEQARSPQVAPGLHLPDEGGIFLLDTYKNQPELSELQQSDLTRNLMPNGKPNKPVPRRSRPVCTFPTKAASFSLILTRISRSCPSCSNRAPIWIKTLSRIFCGRRSIRWPARGKPLNSLEPMPKFRRTPPCRPSTSTSTPTKPGRIRVLAQPCRPGASRRRSRPASVLGSFVLRSRAANALLARSRSRSPEK